MAVISDLNLAAKRELRQVPSAKVVKSLGKEKDWRVRIVAHVDPVGYTLLIDGEERYTDKRIEGVIQTLDMMRLEGKIRDDEIARGIARAIGEAQYRERGSLVSDGNIRRRYDLLAVRNVSDDVCSCGGRSIVDPVSLDFRYRGHALNLSIYADLADMCDVCDYGVASVGRFVEGDIIDWGEGDVFALRGSLINVYLWGLLWEREEGLPDGEFDRQWESALNAGGIRGKGGDDWRYGDWFWSDRDDVRAKSGAAIYERADRNGLRSPGVKRVLGRLRWSEALYWMGWAMVWLGLGLIAVGAFYVANRWGWMRGSSFKEKCGWGMMMGAFMGAISFCVIILIMMGRSMPEHAG